jgi:hypothetical protein
MGKAATVLAAAVVERRAAVLLAATVQMARAETAATAATAAFQIPLSLAVLEQQPTVERAETAINTLADMDLVAVLAAAQDPQVLVAQAELTGLAAVGAELQAAVHFVVVMELKAL